MLAKASLTIRLTHSVHVMVVKAHLLTQMTSASVFKARQVAENEAGGTKVNSRSLTQRRPYVCYVQ